MSFRLPVLLLIAILGLVLGFLFGGKRDGAKEDGTLRPSPGGERENTGTGADSLSAGRGITKVGDRQQKPELTMEETVALAKSTVLPRVSLPAQPLKERVAALNALMEQQAGSGPRLRMSIDPRMGKQWADEGKPDGIELGELDLRSTSVINTATYLVNSAKLRYIIREGELIFTSATPFPEEVEYKRSSADAPLGDDPDGP